MRAGKGTEAGIDHVSGAINRHREKHVLPHALMTWLEEDDARRVSDGIKADRMQGVIHESCVLDAMSAAPRRDELGVQSLGIQPDGTAKQDVKDFEGDVRDMGREDPRQGFESRCTRANVADTTEVSVEIESIRHHC